MPYSNDPIPAINAPARIVAIAGASEVFTSAMTRSLVDGSDLSFEDVGPGELKGFDRPVEVVRLV